MQPGEFFDRRYRLVKPLGSGGFGTVWEAFDTRMQRPVALKVANPARSDGDAERFLGEALTVGSLSHPHIVTVHDYGIASDTGRQLLYVVMELIDGESLDAVLLRGLPQLPQALTWMIQVSDALAAAHGRGVVHRDIKPANVLIEAGGRAKVVDFGIAKNRALPSAPTPAGITVGSFAYVAPERFEGIADDLRSDLYAVGCVLTELCTGLPPFDGVTPANLMHQHTTLTPPVLSTRRADIPSALDELVTELLAKAPADRPPEAAVVRDLLRAVARELDSQGDGASASPMAAPVAAPDSGADAQGHSTNAAPARLLSLSTPAQPPSAAAEATTAPNSRRRAKPRVLALIAATIAVAAIAGLTWLLSPDDGGPDRPSSAKPPASPAGDDRRGTQDGRDAPESTEPSRDKPTSSPSSSRDGREPPEGDAEESSPSGKPPSSSTGKPIDSSRQRTLESGGQADGYGACPKEKVCLFEGWDGTGWMGHAPACGAIDLGSLRFMVSSVRTHGNPVTLYDDNHKKVGHVDGWAQTNLAPEESDRAATAYIHCP